MTEKNIACIIQARMNSSRLPAKVMAPINGCNMLTYVIERVKLSFLENDSIIIATTNNQCDDIIEYVATNYGVKCFRGNENDVLKRYIDAMKQYKIDIAIRVTADCPLIDPEAINQLIDNFLNYYPNSDYIFIDNMPEGIWDAELVSLNALESIYNNTNTTQRFYREHVTTYIHDNPKAFKIHKPTMFKHYSKYKNAQFSVDKLEDLQLVRKIFEHFNPIIDFNVEEIIAYFEQRQLNMRVK